MGFRFISSIQSQTCPDPGLKERTPQAPVASLFGSLVPFEFSRLYADCLDLGQQPFAAGSSAHASFVLESSDLSVACIPDNLFQVSDCKTLGLIGFRV